VDRIDAIFTEPAVSEPETPKMPETYSVEFDAVSFSYGTAGTSARVEALITLAVYRGRR
jgi:hypothetical protein